MFTFSRRCSSDNCFVKTIFDNWQISIRSLKTIAVTLLLLVVSASTGFAQTATGEVNGTVTDPNGGSAPGAIVKLINQATKIEIEVTANQSGYFTFVNVRPADYVLGVEVSGFKRSQTPLFNLGVSQTITQNVVLTVGEVTEVVEVMAASELVQGSTSELGTVISERTVQDLPLNGRNFTQLLTLTPAFASAAGTNATANFVNGTAFNIRVWSAS